MTVIPEKSSQPVVLTIPNKTKKSRYINPAEGVKRLAGQLKIGDKIQISYDKLYSTRTYKSGRSVGSSDTGAKPMVFSFVSTRKIRHGKEYYQAVVAGKGRRTWTFLMPNVEPDAGADASAAAGVRKIPAQPTPDPELAEKIKKYRRGDEVHLTYEPFKYVFALKDIETVQHSDEGILQVSRETTRSGKKMQMLHIRTPKRSVLVFVPAGTEAEGETTKADLVATVKEIKLRAKVAFKYRKEGGLNWLDEISVQ